MHTRSITTLQDMQMPVGPRMHNDYDSTVLLEGLEAALACFGFGHSISGATRSVPRPVGGEISAMPCCRYMPFASLVGLGHNSAPATGLCQRYRQVNSKTH